MRSQEGVLDVVVRNLARSDLTPAERLFWETEGQRAVQAFARQLPVVQAAAFAMAESVSRLGEAWQRVSDTARRLAAPVR